MKGLIKKAIEKFKGKGTIKDVKDYLESKNVKVSERLLRRRMDG